MYYLLVLPFRAYAPRKRLCMEQSIASAVGSRSSHPPANTPLSLLGALEIARHRITSTLIPLHADIGCCQHSAVTAGPSRIQTVDQPEQPGGVRRIFRTLGAINQSIYLQRAGNALQTISWHVRRMPSYTGRRTECREQSFAMVTIGWGH